MFIVLYSSLNNNAYLRKRFQNFSSVIRYQHKLCFDYSTFDISSDRFYHEKFGGSFVASLKHRPQTWQLALMSGPCSGCFLYINTLPPNHPKTVSFSFFVSQLKSHLSSDLSLISLPSLGRSISVVLNWEWFCSPRTLTNIWRHFLGWGGASG